MVAIVELKVNLFVRKSLNQDHVLYLAELLEAGIKLPAIIITPDGRIIDGRHRIEAYDLWGKKEVPAVVRNLTDDSEIISEAYRCNVGGALPPTKEDTEHTVKLLLESGTPQTRIAEALGLPISIARNYIASIKSRQARAKISRAVVAVTDGGLTAAKAAVEHNVDIDKLREALSGKKRKKKWGVDEMKRTFTSSYRSLSSKNAGAIRRLFEKYEDGDVTAKQVEALLKHLENLQRKATRNLADWASRFQGMKDEKRAA
jgi:ParB-like chromosome segregation protein Spo0J